MSSHGITDNTTKYIAKINLNRFIMTKVEFFCKGNLEYPQFNFKIKNHCITQWFSKNINQNYKFGLFSNSFCGIENK